jgi:hypothetical protein
VGHVHGAKRHLTMPRDAFAQLGISRRPAFQLFGTPDVSAGAAGGWTPAAIQAVADEQMLAEEARAAEDERIAREDARADAARKRDAEAKADQFQQMPVSSRQRFLEEEGPAMVASPRYNEMLRHQEQFEPSYADKTLAKSLALKIEDPDDRNNFLADVAAGKGTFAALEGVDRARFNRVQESRLGEVGFGREEREALRANGRYDEAQVNFEIAKRKRENEHGRDPEAIRLRELYKNAAEMVTHSAKMDLMGKADPELVKRMTEHGNALDKYLTTKAKGQPTTTPVGTGTVLRPVEAPAASPQTVPSTTTRPFKEVMAGGATPLATVAAQPADIQKQLDEHMDSPEVDDKFFSTLIANPSIPIEAKQKALEKFRAYVANPPADPALDVAGTLARRADLKDLLVKAEEEVKFHPEREKFNQAWDASKTEIDRMVDNFAKRLNLPKSSVLKSLAKGATLEIPGRGPVPMEDLLVEEMDAAAGKPLAPEAAARGGNKPHPFWGMEASALQPFKSSRFAGRLGTKVGLWPVMQTQRSVLDAYLKDQQPAAKPVAASPPVRIKSITPIN